MKNGNNIKDRQGNPLAFTPAVKLIETDKNRLEVAGIRVIKYPPDYNGYMEVISEISCRFSVMQMSSSWLRKQK
jgi:hypothetical protein